VVLEPKLDSRRATRKKAAPLFGKKDHSSWIDFTTHSL
jgi:hypothetical protein